MMLHLTRFELLEACNRISGNYGGCNLGTVQGYRNQYLISVELKDTKEAASMLRMVQIMKGVEPDVSEIEDLVWIRCGFCQSSIKRAPRGGFTLEIDWEILEQCRTPGHVVAYFETWLGNAAEREHQYYEWKRVVDAAAIEDDALAKAFRLTREVQQLEEVFGATVTVVQ